MRLTTGMVKPVNIIVLTNSSHPDNVAKAIRLATRKSNQGLHHPNAVGIQFVQLGNDSYVEKALRKLCEDSSFVSSSTQVQLICSDISMYRILWTLYLFGPCMRTSFRVRVYLYFILISPVYYYVYNKDGAIHHEAYRVRERRIYRVQYVLKLCLSTMHNIDLRKTRLFATSSSKSALADGTPVPLNSSQTLGLIPDEPFPEVIPQTGIKPETVPAHPTRFPVTTLTTIL